jgi:hypothetical protein
MAQPLQVIQAVIAFTAAQSARSVLVVRMAGKQRASIVQRREPATLLVLTSAARALETLLAPLLPRRIRDAHLALSANHFVRLWLLSRLRYRSKQANYRHRLQGKGRAGRVSLPRRSSASMIAFRSSARYFTLIAHG